MAPNTCRALGPTAPANGPPMTRKEEMTDANNPYPRPRVVVSKCLGFAACRYNGLTIPDDFVQQLGPWVDYLTVCAEVQIGLGVPRQPVRIVSMAGEERLLQPGTGADVTEAMRGFAESYLDQLPAVDGFILKSRSPSCGIKDVRIYMGPDKGAAAQIGAGMFARAVLQRFAGLAIEDEGRLRNARIREHFLTSSLPWLASARLGIRAPSENWCATRRSTSCC